MLASLKHFSGSEIAQERLRIISFYSKHGELATKEAFKVDRKLVYVWKKRLKASKGKLSSLPLFPLPLSQSGFRKLILW